MVVLEEGKKRIYRFEEMWFRDGASAEVIKKAWEGEGDVRQKLS